MNERFVVNLSEMPLVYFFTPWIRIRITMYVDPKTTLPTGINLNFTQGKKQLNRFFLTLELEWGAWCA